MDFVMLVIKSPTLELRSLAENICVIFALQIYRVKESFLFR